MNETPPEAERPEPKAPPPIPPKTEPTPDPEPDPDPEVVMPSEPERSLCAAQNPAEPTGFMLGAPVDCTAIAAAIPGGRRPYQDSQANPSCGRASNYVEYAYNRDAYDLHVIGVYEPDRDVSASIIRVRVQPSDRPIVLALSGHRAVTWQLDVDPNAQLEAVIAVGHHEPQVEGTTAPVHVLPPNTLCGTAFGWELTHNAGGGDFTEFQAALRSITGLTERSFQGCYSASEFVVPFSETCATVLPPTEVNGDETIVPGKTTFTQCPSLDADDHVCLTASGPNLRLEGVESGNVCPIRSMPAFPSDDQGMWWHGEIVYACTSQGLLRASLIDSSYEVLNIGCSGVGEVNGEILVIPGFPSGPLDDVISYADVDALYNADGRALRDMTPPPTSRFSIIDDSIYGVWHSSDELIQRDPSGAYINHALGGHDGWVNSMSVTEDGVMIFEDHRRGVWALDIHSQQLGRANVSSASARACIRWQ